MPEDSQHTQEGQAAASRSQSLTPEQLHFFNTFGFLKLPGLLAEDMAEIGAAFDKVMAAPDVPGMELDYADGGRFSVPGILGMDSRLQQLKSDRRILDPCRSILGDDLEYAEDAGEIMHCETTWHRDTYGAPLDQLHVKILIYFEELNADNGTLRVLPGSNFIKSAFSASVQRGQGFPDKMQEVFGVPGRDLPCTVIDTQPGDVIALNFRTIHATFGGSANKRRMINLNYRERKERNSEKT